MTPAPTPSQTISPIRLLIVSTSSIIPNEWNMNELSLAMTKKLLAGLKKVKAETGTYLPILCRKHPTLKGKYQIVDGEHRWRLCKEDLREQKLPILLCDLPDELAKMLTVTMNYLGGEPDKARYAQLISSLEKTGTSLGEQAALFPETVEELKSLVEEEAERVQNALTASVSANKAAPEVEKEEFVERTFVVSREQAEVIDRELKRIKQELSPNARSDGNALEYMAALSSQTPFKPPKSATSK